jgi:hypothetical protein
MVNPKDETISKELRRSNSSKSPQLVHSRRKRKRDMSKAITLTSGRHYKRK